MPNNLMKNNSYKNSLSNIKVLKPIIKDFMKALQININPEYIEAYNNFKKVAKSIQKISNTIKYVASQITPIVMPKISLAINNFITNTRIIKGHWVVIDEELFNLLKTKKNVEDVTKTIVDFYTKNRYEKLIEIFNEIETLNIIPERIHILKSCIQILKSSSKKHAYNVIIPTLLAQITGIIEEDCIKLIPNNVLIKKENGNKVSGVKEVSNALEYFDSSLLFYEMFNSAIIKGLFKNVSQTDYEEYKKECGSNRHKVLHGDKNFLDYGTKENLVRTFLDLYMLCVTKLFLENVTENIEAINNAK